MNTKKLTNGMSVIAMATMILVTAQSHATAAGTISTAPVSIKVVQRALNTLEFNLDDMAGRLDAEKRILAALRKRLNVTKDASTILADLAAAKERVVKADKSVVGFGKTADRIESMIGELYEIAVGTGDLRLGNAVAAAADQLKKLRTRIGDAGIAVEKLKTEIADIERMIEEMPAVSPAA